MEPQAVPPGPHLYRSSSQWCKDHRFACGSTKQVRTNHQS